MVEWDLNLDLSRNSPALCQSNWAQGREGGEGMAVATWSWNNRPMPLAMPGTLASPSQGWWHDQLDTPEDLRNGSWFYSNYPKPAKNPHPLNSSP